jgi:RNA polymerase sigma factor (sigma-70 family)
MTANPIRRFLEILRGQAFLAEGKDQSDGQLLERFVGGDGGALETLVHRHAPMVWSVCRRNLPRHDDAEDAFQATFLVLLRRAASIRSRELLANWLYGVAYKTARKARQTASTHGIREQQMPTLLEPPTEPPDDTFGPELRARLDDELNRLPEKYRIAVVLCDLQERSLRAVAQELRVAQGTVASRLARGRKMLARRLAHHATTVTATSVAAVLTEQAASAAVPDALLRNTIKAVTLRASGESVPARLLSGKAYLLTDAVLHALARAKWKAARLVLLLAVLALAGGAVAYHILPDPPSDLEQPPQPRKVSTADPDAPKYGTAAGARNAAKLLLWLDRGRPFAGTGEFGYWPSRSFKATLDRKTELWTVTGLIRGESKFVKTRDGFAVFAGAKLAYWEREWKAVLRYNPSSQKYDVVSHDGSFLVGGSSMPPCKETGWAPANRDESLKWIQGKFQKPLKSDAPISSLHLVGDLPVVELDGRRQMRTYSRVRLGRTQRYAYTGKDMTVEKSSRGVTINIVDTTSRLLDAPDSQPEKKRWVLQFAGPDGRPLQVGEHGGVGFGPAAPLIGMTLRFEHPKKNDLRIGSVADPTVANFLRLIDCGEFIVWEMEMKDEKVVRLAIDFIIGDVFGLDLDSTRPSWWKPSCGSLRFNSSFRPAIPDLPPDEVLVFPPPPPPDPRTLPQKGIEEIKKRG